MTHGGTIVVFLVLFTLTQVRRRLLLNDDPHGRYWPRHCWLRVRFHSWTYDTDGHHEKECEHCGVKRYTGPPVY